MQIYDQSLTRPLPSDPNLSSCCRPWRNHCCPSYPWDPLKPHHEDPHCCLIRQTPWSHTTKTAAAIWSVTPLEATPRPLPPSDPSDPSKPCPEDHRRHLISQTPWSHTTKTAAAIWSVRPLEATPRRPLPPPDPSDPSKPHREDRCRHLIRQTPWSHAKKTTAVIWSVRPLEATPRRPPPLSDPSDPWQPHLWRPLSTTDPSESPERAPCRHPLIHLEDRCCLIHQIPHHEVILWSPEPPENHPSDSSAPSQTPFPTSPRYLSPSDPPVLARLVPWWYLDGPFVAPLDPGTVKTLGDPATWTPHGSSWSSDQALAPW